MICQLNSCSQKYYRSSCHTRFCSLKWFCKPCPGGIWTSGHLFLVTPWVLPWQWEWCAQHSPHCAVCPLLTQTNRDQQGIVWPLEGLWLCHLTQDHRRSQRLHKCPVNYLCKHPPANPPARPPLPPPSAAWGNQRNAQKHTACTTEAEHEFGMSEPEFLAPKRAFQPDRTAEIQIQVLSSEFLPLHTTWCPCTHLPLVQKVSYLL